MKKRAIAALLAVMLLISLLPTMAFAAYSGNANPIITSATVVWKDNKNQIKLVMSSNYGNGQELHVGVVNANFVDTLCTGTISNISDAITTNALGVYVNIPANAANVQGGTVFADLPSLPKADDYTNDMVNGSVKLLVWSSGTGTGNWNLSSAGDAVTITDGKGEVTKEDPTKDLYTIGAAKTYTGSALNPDITPDTGAGSVTNIYLADDNAGTNKTTANAGKTNAGTYHVFVDVDPSTLYNDKTDLYLGTWTINKATLAGTVTLTHNDTNTDGIINNGETVTATYTNPGSFTAGTDFEFEWTADGTADSTQKGATFTAGADVNALSVEVVAKGDNTQNPTTAITASLAGKTMPTLTGDTTLTANYGDTDKALSFTTTSDSPITYTVTAGTDVVEVSADGKLTIKKAGSATVTVAVAESDTYAAKSTTVAITVNKADPTLTLGNLSQTVGSVTAVTATSNLEDANVVKTIKYQIPATTAVNNADCNCGAADALAHTKDCAKVADPDAECDCDAADGVAADKVHQDACQHTKANAGQHCDCNIRTELAADATHTAGCAAVTTHAAEWKEFNEAPTNTTLGATVEAWLNSLPANSTVNVQVTSAELTDKLNAVTTPVTGTLTINAAPSNTGGVSSDFTVTYAAGAHGTINGATSEKVKRNESPVNVPTVTANKGYAFIGWSLDGKTIVNPAAQTITKNTTFTALYGDHLAYMVGRSATEFVPNGNLTRAEAAAILSRLTEGFEEDGTYPAAPYSDLTAGAWYVKYVNFAADKGIVNGRDNGTFDPDANITRAEFATMIANFAKIAKVDTAAVSTDVAGHWAEGYIAALEQAKVVTGYEDGTFKPNANITRAEAATMVNGAIGRVPMSELDLAANGYVNPFVDVTTSQWFYAQVMEATASHLSGHFHK